MITADQLETLTTFTAPALSRAVRVSNNDMPDITGSKFLGITNGGQFCYSVTYFDDYSGKDARCKVFLTYDSVNGGVRADIG